jgi:hypothetical protein
LDILQGCNGRIIYYTPALVHTEIWICTLL